MLVRKNIIFFLLLLKKSLIFLYVNYKTGIFKIWEIIIRFNIKN